MFLHLYICLKFIQLGNKGNKPLGDRSEDLELHTLKKDIERCRQRMILLASSTSMLDSDVIKASTELDSLINLYQTQTRYIYKKQ